MRRVGPGHLLAQALVLAAAWAVGSPPAAASDGKLAVCLGSREARELSLAEPNSVNTPEATEEEEAGMID